MAQWIDGLAAKSALLVFIPFRDNVPDQAILRVRLNLSQAFVAAILFRPARALAEPKCRLIEKSVECGLPRGCIDRCGFLCLRTGDRFPRKLKYVPTLGIACRMNTPAPSTKTAMMMVRTAIVIGHLPVGITRLQQSRPSASACCLIQGCERSSGKAVSRITGRCDGNHASGHTVQLQHARFN